MTGYRLGPQANAALDDIYTYTASRWDEAQADRYITGLFRRFDDIADRRIPWRRAPAELVPDSWFCRHESHVIYWKLLADGSPGIFAILHMRMHQAARLGEITGDDNERI